MNERIEKRAKLKAMQDWEDEATPFDPVWNKLPKQLRQHLYEVALQKLLRYEQFLLDVQEMDKGEK